MRHDRQIKLAGVGEDGQLRIAAARVVVPAAGFVGEVATRYLAGAGIGHLTVTTPALADVARRVDPEAQVDVEEGIELREIIAPYPWRRRGPADLAAGSYLALLLLRRSLQETT